MGVEDVAGYLGVTKTTVYRWCKEGRIPCMKIGRYWRVRREALGHLQKKATGGCPL